MNRVREIRKERGISQERLAMNIAISRKYLSMIERQTATPSISIAMRIGTALGVSLDKVFIDLSKETPAVFPQPIRYIDLFCGIGGFRYASQAAFDKLGIKGECVFSSDIDKYAQDSYEANFGERPSGDITKIAASEIPDFDVLFGGFPCQAFSICGLRKGFADNTRGTLFLILRELLKKNNRKLLFLKM